MGAAASIANRDELAVLTAIELGNKISELGEDYVGYKDLFTANNLDGATVSSLTKDDQIQKLKDIGISNESHQEALIAEFEKLKVAEPTEPVQTETIQEEKKEEMVTEESKTAEESNETVTDLKVEGVSVKRSVDEDVVNNESVKRQSTGGGETAAAPISEGGETAAAPISEGGETAAVPTSTEVEVQA